MLLAVSLAFGRHAGEVSVNVTKDPLNIALSAGGTTFMEIVKLNLGGREITSATGESTEGDDLVLRFDGGITLTLRPVHRGIHFHSESEGADEFRVYYKDKGEHFYGVSGESYFENDDQQARNDVLDMRGTKRSVKWLADRGDDTWLNGHWGSFFMTTGGYGCFVDTWNEGEYDFRGENDLICLRHNTGTMNWYIFYGPTGAGIHEGLYKAVSELEGGLPTPMKSPLWTSGPMYWQDEHHEGSAEVLREAKAYTDREVPATAMWVDRPYSKGDAGWSEIAWDDRFADPGRWIGTMHDEYNINVTTWIGLYNGGDENCEMCVRNNNRYDWTDPNFKTWFEQKLTQYQYQHGIMGHKIDRAGIYDPGSFDDGTPPEQSQQLYPYHTARGVHEILTGNRGGNVLLYSIFAYNRSFCYLNSIHNGDSRKAWPGLKTSISQAMRSSFLGWHKWGSEAGGYRTELPPGGVDGGDEGFVRWLQFCLWSGNFWVNRGEDNFNRPREVVDLYRDISEQRMKLLPYLHSIANTADRTGVMMRPMAYLYPDDPNTYHLGHQYLFGPTFLVAPIYEHTDTREVYLPEGTWINYHDLSEVHQGGGTVTAAAPIEHIPVFVKKNAIYLDGRIYDGNSRNWIENFDATRYVDVHAFPGDPGESTTFIYVDALDRDTEKLVTLRSRTDGVVTLEFGAMAVGGTARIRVDSEPENVFLNGEETADYQYDAGTGVVSLAYPDGTPVTIQAGGQDPVRARVANVQHLFESLRLIRDGSHVRLSLDGVNAAMTHAPLGIGLYDMRGRRLWYQHVGAGDPVGTSLMIPLGAGSGRGMYVLKIAVSGAKRAVSRTCVVAGE